VIVSAWRRLVGFGFRLLYNEFAFTYDAVSALVSFGEWRSWVNAAIPHLNAPAGAPILELAHGTGHLQLALRAAGYTPTGLDLSRAMGRLARRKLLAQNLPLRLVEGRAQVLPFAQGAFAALVCTFPAPFILDAETLREAARVLIPGGRFVIVPNASLTRGGLAREGLELAYRVTGQRAPFPAGIPERFAAAGFTLSRADVPFRRSTAHVLIATRQGERSDSPADSHQAP